ncbi:MAG TPA: molybdate ABC transporter substrate-binding protein, partial [Blastocatellia bacterium]
MLGLTGISNRSGDIRLAAARAVGRFWLSAMLIVGAAASLACRHSDKTVANSNSQAAREITVSAAASLKDAFGEIGKQYESSRGAKVNFNFGSSGALQKQIESGAPVDVFASAGIPQM